MRPTTTGLLVTLAMAAMMVSPVKAQTIISFDDPGATDQTGTVFYDFATDQLTGTDIVFNQVSFGGFNLDCVGCVLNFTTTAATSETIGGGSALAEFGTDGGTFVLEGDVYDPNNGNVLVASGILLTGSFVAAGPLTPSFEVSNLGGVTSGEFTGGGIDTKNEALLAYIGVDPGDFVFANTTQSLANCTIGELGIACNVTNADLDNVRIPVPEPAMLGLLGLGLLGMAVTTRRRMSAV